MSSRSELSKFAIRQIEVQRKNLIHVCRYAVKTLVDVSCSEGLSDDSPEVDNFCAIMEQIFSHRLRPHMSWLGNEEPRHFWDYIRTACKGMHSSSIDSVQQMEAPKSARGKGRAWIRMALMEKRLSDYVSVALKNDKVTRQYYQDGAVMTTAEDKVIFTGTLIALNAIDLSFDLRCCGEQLDFKGVPNVDYTPYLRFEAKPEPEAEFEPSAESVPGTGPGELELHSLRTRCYRLEQKYKVADEQKTYLDELVRIRDQQLEEARERQAKLEATAGRSERERQELEKVVLELQNNITRMQNIHRGEVSRLQGMLRQYVDDPPLIALTELPSRENAAAGSERGDVVAGDDDSECATDSLFPLRTTHDSRSNQSHRSILSTNSGNTSRMLEKKIREETQSLVPLVGSLTSDISNEDFQNRKSEVHYTRSSGGYDMDDSRYKSSSQKPTSLSDHKLVLAGHSAGSGGMGSQHSMDGGGPDDFHKAQISSVAADLDYTKDGVGGRARGHRGRSGIESDTDSELSAEVCIKTEKLSAFSSKLLQKPGDILVEESGERLSQIGESVHSAVTPSQTTSDPKSTRDVKLSGLLGPSDKEEEEYDKVTKEELGADNENNSNASGTARISSSDSDGIDVIEDVCTSGDSDSYDKCHGEAPEAGASAGAPHSSHDEEKIAAATRNRDMNITFVVGSVPQE